MDDEVPGMPIINTEYTVDQLTFFKFKIQGFSDQEIMAIFDWDKAHFEKVKAGGLGKLRVYNVLPDTWGSEGLRMVIEWERLGKSHKKADNSGGYGSSDNPKISGEELPNYVNLMKKFVGKDPIWLADFYDDETFQSLGYSEKHRMCEDASIMVYLGFVRQEDGFYITTEEGRARLREVLNKNGMKRIE
jgi:hypothetical protein